MTAAVILILSGVLIGAGLNVLWRDLSRHRRPAFVSQRDEGNLAPMGEAEADVVIAHVPSEEPAGQTRLQGFRAVPARQDTGDAVTEPRRRPRELNEERADDWLAASRPAGDEEAVAGSGEAPASAHRSHPLEQQWASLAPHLAAAADQVNAVLAPLQLSVGAMGEPAWSYKNKGFGGYRRLLLSDESIAWLRLELSADGELHAGIKAHKDERSGINMSAHVPAAGLDATQASDLLSHCLKPAATFAAGVAPPAAEDDDDGRGASADAWSGIDATVVSALKATNGALAQAGARLAPLGPAAWDAQTRRHRLTLAVEVRGEDVARMLIEQHLQPQEIEVSVGVREPSLIELGRRRRMAATGVTIHALAELIAGCAWPTIARYRTARRSA
jgi:hypothetical protein